MSDRCHLPPGDLWAICPADHIRNIASHLAVVHRLAQGEISCRVQVMHRRDAETGDSLLGI
jgi:hypothetical protein